MSTEKVRTVCAEKGGFLSKRSQKPFVAVAVAQHVEHRVEGQLDFRAHVLQAGHTLGVVLQACGVVVLAREQLGLEVLLALIDVLPRLKSKETRQTRDLFVVVAQVVVRLHGPPHHARSPGQPRQG